MPNNFVIYAFPRTGSYHLASLLNSAKDVVCHGEVFKVNRIEVPRWHLGKLPYTLQTRDANPIEFIRDLRRLNPWKHFGFKLFDDHAARVPHLRYILQASKWKKIALIRAPIEVYASLLRASQTNIWMVQEGQAVDESTLRQKVRFTEDSWQKFVAGYGFFLQRCHSVENTMVVKYGYYSKSDQLQKILEFVGSEASATDLREKTRKQFTGDVSGGFENWDDFQTFLKVVPPPPY